MVRISLLLSDLEKGSTPSTPIAGGYAAGDQVVSLLTWDGGKTGSVSYGDVGTVLRPGNAGNAATRVNCKFPNCSNLDLLLSQLEKGSDHAAARAAEVAANQTPSASRPSRTRWRWPSSRRRRRTL